MPPSIDVVIRNAGRKPAIQPSPHAQMVIAGRISANSVPSGCLNSKTVVSSIVLLAVISISPTVGEAARSCTAAQAARRASSFAATVSDVAVGCTA